MQDSLRQLLRLAAGQMTMVAARSIRRIVPRQSSLFAWLQILRSHLPAAKPLSPVESILRQFKHQYPKAFFIQIGSNDGSNLDPLRQSILSSRWTGILVEPVPYIFARLRANYRSRRGLTLENVAIAEQDGNLPFYYLRTSENAAGLPVWYETLGSFSKDVVLKHKDRIPDIEQRIVCEPVKCMSFESLCRKHDVSHVDLIHVDAEGYDFRILQQIDFGRFRPRLLMYEHHHLSATDRAVCRVMLQRHGYEGFEYGLDTMCLNLRDPGPRDEPLVRLWHQLV